MKRGLRWLAALGMLAPMAGQGLAASPQAPTLKAQLHAGIEVSDSDSHRFDVGGEWYLPREWEIAASASRADFALTGDDVASTAASLVVRHDLGSFQLGAGLGHAELQDRTTTRSVFITSTYWRDDWRLQAGLGTRETELGATEFEEDLGGSIGLASGVSRCEARSLAANASADLLRASWRLYARAAFHDYGDVDCELTISTGGNGNGNGNGNGPPVHARGRALGLRLVTNTLEQVVGINPRLIPRDAMLLKSSLALGAAVSRPSGWQFGGEVYRDVDWLRGQDFFTAVTYGNREITRNWTLELSLGYATSSLEDSLFAGIRMSASIY
jgi:hypothetical protein